MQKIVIIPDSFKGTISSREAGKIIQEEAMARWPKAEIIRAEVGQYGKLGTLATKVYEYMSLGLPVVLSSTPYNTEAVERCRFGICADPEDTESIAAAITYLLDHPEEARRMGENGRKAVKEEFNWGVEEKKLLALYEDILKE